MWSFRLKTSNHSSTCISFAAQLNVRGRSFENPQSVNFKACFNLFPVRTTKLRPQQVILQNHSAVVQLMVQTF